MKSNFITLSALLILSWSVAAKTKKNVLINEGSLSLGFGQGFFPKNTILSENGKFKISLPPNVQLESATFTENFDEMCEFINGTQDENTFELSINASSSEYSECVLELQLSNGKNSKITGIFSSGE